MKIKDMERLTGIPKASIRYYESMGLLSPRREENGYRDYSQADAEELLRIKLLRGLDIPMETIRELQKGTLTMEQALRGRKARFDSQHAQLQNAETVVTQMLDGRLHYGQLQPEAYLDMLDDIPPDKPPRGGRPWRRYFARIFDLMLYGMIVDCFEQALGLDFSFLVQTAIHMLLMILIEPVLLSLFATTPGKLIFGITVTNPDGEKLTHDEASRRIFLIVQYGLGFGVLQDFFLYSSMVQTEEGRPLIWEEGSRVHFRDGKNWRYILYVGLTLLILTPSLRSISQDFGDLDIQLRQNSWEKPFYNVYRVEGESSFVTLRYEQDDDHTYDALYMYNGTKTDVNAFDDQFRLVGLLEYTGDADAGVWTLTTEGETCTVTVTADSTTLTVGDTVRSLYRVDTLTVLLKAEGEETRYADVVWYEEGCYDGETEFTQVDTVSTMKLGMADHAGRTLTITEEVHDGGTVTAREIALEKDESGLFCMEVGPVEGYILYRIDHAGGEYIFGIE